MVPIYITERGLSKFLWKSTYTYVELSMQVVCTYLLTYLKKEMFHNFHFFELTGLFSRYVVCYILGLIIPHSLSTGN